MILRDVLSFNIKSAQGSVVVVKGFGGGFLSMSLHNIHLQYDLVSGNIVVALCSHIPIDGVSFILGNDLAFGRVQVVSKGSSTPFKTDSPDELELAYPETFSVCVTTRAM